MITINNSNCKCMNKNTDEYSQPWYVQKMISNNEILKNSKYSKKDESYR